MAICLVLLLLISLSHASEWAILVAGSSGYTNYRHQADVCHSYQLLRSQGIPASNIIVFSANDVVNSSSNPFPGRLFNAPGSSATNVYAGCVVDYAGSANNSTNFLAVLTGDEAAVRSVGSGRVLKSWFWDTVFISFVDHGAPGLLAFPSDNDYLYADTLIATLRDMKFRGMFRRLLFFVDACDSGSMFDGLLPSYISVYAVTAASDLQFSWGTYCPPDDVADGEAMNTCLGDLFTVSWMEAVSRSDSSEMTLSDLVAEVSSLTNMSTVRQFGDLSLARESIGTFFGTHKAPAESEPSAPIEVGWRSRDAAYLHLSQLYLADPTTSRAYQLMDELSARAEVTAIFSELMDTLSPINPLHLYLDSRNVTNFECLRAAVQGFEKSCGTLSEFGLSYVRVLRNACEEDTPAETISSALHTICGGDIEAKKRKHRTKSYDWDDHRKDRDDHDETSIAKEDDFFGEPDLSFWDWIIGA